MNLKMKNKMTKPANISISNPAIQVELLKLMAALQRKFWIFVKNNLKLIVDLSTFQVTGSNIGGNKAQFSQQEVTTTYSIMIMMESRTQKLKFCQALMQIT